MEIRWMIYLIKMGLLRSPLLLAKQAICRCVLIWHFGKTGLGKNEMVLKNITKAGVVAVMFVFNKSDKLICIVATLINIVTKFGWMADDVWIIDFDGWVKRIASLQDI